MTADSTADSSTTRTKTANRADEADEAPAANEPSAHRPAAEKPPAQDPPADEPSADESSADKPPADDRPAAKAPAAERTADEQPADEQPADEQPADEQPTDEQPADRQPDDEHPADEQQEPSPADAVRRTRRRTRLASLAVPLVYLAASFALYIHLWTDLRHAYLVDSMRDQNQWEWFFAVTAHNVLHGHNPLFTDLQNFPLGVNLMANTVMLGLSAPLAPLTAHFGPTVAFAGVLTVGLAATATTWHWLIRRYLTRNRLAALVGGAFSAFAPPMVSHANAHPNLVVLFVIPLIIDRALRLCRVPTVDGRIPGAGARWWRRALRTTGTGIVLGLLLAWQIYLGEEALLLAASGMVLFGFGYVCVRPSVLRRAFLPLLGGGLVAAAVCVPLVAYALHWQFFGPQSYHSIHHGATGNSPLALVEFSGRALAGDKDTAAALSLNPTEQNAFYGWPLVSLMLGITVVLWDRAVVKALSWTAFVAALLSLGARIPLPRTDTTIPGPWQPLDKLPLFESVIESRYALVCAPVIGMLLALVWSVVAESAGAPRAAGRGDDRDRRHRALIIRVFGCLVLGAALLPIVPKPLETVKRPAVPSVVASGEWRSFVKPGQSLVPVPLPSPSEASALAWQTEADFRFPLPGGYFNGPYGPQRAGIYGAVPRDTSELLRDVRYSGRVPAIGETQKQAAREDLAYWKAGALVLAPQPNDTALRITLEQLLGKPGKRVGDAWVWDVG